MKTTALTTLAIAAAIVTQTSLARADVETSSIRIHTSSPGDLFGISVAALGDVDGDGMRDYAVSGPSGFSGIVNVYSGATGHLIHQLSQPGTINFFGYAVADMGDVNGDGHADIVIGSPLDGSTLQFFGRVWMYSGANGQAMWSVSGTQTAEGFGWAVTQVGDADFDGINDVAIGAPFWDNEFGDTVGRVVIVSGATGEMIGTWQGQGELSESGRALCAAPDLNDDGVNEFLVGCPGSDRVSVVNGLSLQTMHELNGQIGSQFGLTIARMGDVTGDNVPDFVVGSPRFIAGSNSIGAVTAFDGRLLTSLWRTTGEADSHYGASLAAGIDSDSDGFDDVCVGAPRHRVLSRLVGRMHVVSGLDGTQLKAFNGSMSTIWFGASVAALDDIDGDGVRDMLVGREGASTDAGAGYVIRGATNPPGAMSVEWRDPSYETMFRPMLHDLDRDGAADLLILDRPSRRLGVRMCDGFGDFWGMAWLAIDGEPVSITLADIDRDGDKDVLVAARSPHGVTIFRNVYGILFKSGIIPLPHEPVDVAAADFNGDNLVDLAVAHRSPRSISVYRHRPSNNPAPHVRFKLHTTLPLKFAPSHLMTARINHGRADLLAISAKSRRASVMLHLSGFNFSHAYHTPIGPSKLPLVDVAVADFNGDGLADLVVTDGVTHTPALHMSMGNGRFAPKRSDLNAGMPVRSLAAADLDADGRRELVCGASDGTIKTMWNLITPFHSHTLEFAGTAEAMWLCTGDIDRDADVDVLAIGPTGAMTLLRNLLSDP